MTIPMPHDLVWVNDSQSLMSESALPKWVHEQWDCSLPLVVRRETPVQQGLLAVGIRGAARNERAAAWIRTDAIIKLLTPEDLVTQLIDNRHGLDIAYRPLLTLSILLEHQWPWRWGVTGGCGYFLATQRCCINDNSDLDLRIHCASRPNKTQFDKLIALLPQLPCRVDIQLESANGACSLLEWYNKSQVLLKTPSGPLLVTDPWDDMETST